MSVTAVRPDELRQMQEQRMHLVAEYRDFNAAMLERAKENNGERLAEDRAESERREKELVNLNDLISSQLQAQAVVANDPADFVVAGEKGQQTFQEYRSASLERKPLPQTDITQSDVDEAARREAIYKWVMYGRDGLDFEEYRVLSKAASGGGFFVPTDLADNIVRALRFLPGGVGALGRNITTSGGETINIPRNLTHGTAAWIAESGSYTPSDETITQGTISAFKAGSKIIVSEELLTDTEFELEPFISTEFGERIGALAEDAYVNGDGSGKPTGLLDAASGLTVSTLPAGQVTTLTYAAFAAAMMTVPAQYRDNMSLLVSDSLFVRFITLVDTTGRPIWAPSMGAGAPDRVLGIPVFTHPNLPASGANAKSAIIGDFGRGYMIRRVNGIYMQRQNELHSDSGQVGFRAYLRLDGKVQLADALRVIAFAPT